MTVFEAYITNLGKYAEGQLVGEMPPANRVGKGSVGSPKRLFKI